MKLRTTRGEIERFKESMIWLDMLDELARLDKTAVMEYEFIGEQYTNDSGHTVIPTTAEALIHLGDIKGRRKAVQTFISLPDIFLAMLEEKLDEDEEEVSDE